MSFAGHVLDMISRFQYNEYLRKRRRERYRVIRDRYLEEVNIYHGELTNRPAISKEEMEQIKEKIRTSLINERKAAVTKSIIATFIVVFAISYFIYYLISNGAFEGFYF